MLQMYGKTLRQGFFILCGVLLFDACAGEKQQSENPESETQETKIHDKWLIDPEVVEEGCDRADCIRSIDKPVFISVNEVSYLEDEDLVIGLRLDDEIKCYPHIILDYHEIVNDAVDGKEIAINYCPLTGSGMAWNREIDGKKTTFGISGLLYNSNVIPYDRETRSIWSQMKQVCVNGELVDKKPETFQSVETKWGTWKKLYPDSKVLSLETGMSRDYGTYPYYDYKETKEIMFDVANESDTLHAKERLFGVIENDKAACYRFANFKGGVRLMQDTMQGKQMIVIGSERDNFMVAFENPGNKKFRPTKNNVPAIFEDEDQNTYDLFGYCVAGKNMGQRLKPMNGFVAYWFAWYAFYPDVTWQ